MVTSQPTGTDQPWPKDYYDEKSYPIDDTDESSDKDEK